MNRVKILAASALSALAISGSAAAATVLDQDQESHAQTLVVFQQPDLAQSFQQAVGDIAGAGIFLSANGTGPAAITISLWDALPNQGGTQLASGHDTTFSNSHWFDVFWNPVAITANHTYYLVFTSTVNPNYGISGDLHNPYSRGNAYANAGFGNLPTYDFTFRTYASDTFGTPAAGRAVPEPASWALMILGFGLAGSALRRRVPAAA